MSKKLKILLLFFCINFININKLYAVDLQTLDAVVKGQNTIPTYGNLLEKQKNTPSTYSIADVVRQNRINKDVFDSLQQRMTPETNYVGAFGTGIKRGFTEFFTRPLKAINAVKISYADWITDEDRDNMASEVIQLHRAKQQSQAMNDYYAGYTSNQYSKFLLFLGRIVGVIILFIVFTFIAGPIGLGISLAIWIFGVFTNSKLDNISSIYSYKNINMISNEMISVIDIIIGLLLIIILPIICKEIYIDANKHKNADKRYHKNKKYFKQKKNKYKKRKL